MSRYEIPDPKCHHVHHAVRVTAGHLHGTYASRWVCDREACIEDAKEWAATYTRQPVEVVRKGEYSTAERVTR